MGYFNRSCTSCQATCIFKAEPIVSGAIILKQTEMVNCDLPQILECAKCNSQSGINTAQAISFGGTLTIQTGTA
jgi:hypothetical protein